jgi:hypothetical protein
MAENTTRITTREKVALLVLLFALKILNPTGYEHQIQELKEAIEKQL